MENTVLDYLCSQIWVWNFFLFLKPWQCFSMRMLSDQPHIEIMKASSLPSEQIYTISWLLKVNWLQSGTVLLLDSSQILLVKVYNNSVSVENTSITLNMSCIRSEHFTHFFQLRRIAINCIPSIICFKWRQLLFYVLQVFFVYIQTNMSLYHHVSLQLCSFFLKYAVLMSTPICMYQ